MITQRTVQLMLICVMLIIASVALSGCCCGVQEQLAKYAERAKQEAAENESGDDDDDDDDGDDDDDDDDGDDDDDDGDDDDDLAEQLTPKIEEDSGSKKGARSASKIAIKDATGPKVIERLKALDWNILNKSESESIFTITARKGNTMAVFGIQTLPSRTAAKLAVKTLKKNNMVVERDGKKMVYISVPNNIKAARKLMGKIIKD